MAKKRPHDQLESHSVEIHEEPTSDQESAAEPASANVSGSLMDEVQSFMTLRDELSRKLAAEIEATELKLAELKETAASLFPQNSEATEEKKAKKPKPKAPKEEKSSSTNTSETEAVAA